MTHLIHRNVIPTITSSKKHNIIRYKGGISIYYSKKYNEIGIGVPGKNWFINSIDHSNNDTDFYLPNL